MKEHFWGQNLKIACKIYISEVETGQSHFLFSFLSCFLYEKRKKAKCCNFAFKKLMLLSEINMATLY